MNFKLHGMILHNFTTLKILGLTQFLLLASCQKLIEDLKLEKQTDYYTNRLNQPLLTSYIKIENKKCSAVKNSVCNWTTFGQHKY